MRKTIRKYEPIWRALKDSGYCEIITASYAVHRVKKAVIKEKYNDERFKELYTSTLTIEIKPTRNPLETVLIFRLEKFSNFVKGRDKL